jgi:dipeptide/tripeptide permease
MSGTIWGFATRAEGRHAAILHALSTGPALWALFLGFSTILLALGFLLLLLLDWHAQRTGLAPPWWMRLRLLLTALVSLASSRAALIRRR